MKLHKKIILVLCLCSASACTSILGVDHYVKSEPEGRMQLKTMEFKDSFLPEMGYFVDENVIYYNENVSKDYAVYAGIRFFKTGQYIAYSSHNEFTIEPFNYLDKGLIGYFNVDLESGIIILETPSNLDKSQNMEISIDKVIMGSGHSVKNKYKIIEGGSLQSISSSSSNYIAEYLDIFRKQYFPNLKPIKPDW